MKAMKALTGAPEIAVEERKPQLPESIPPLPINKMVAHERRCQKLLHDAWQTLHRLGATPVAVAYEELYRAPSVQDVAKVLNRILTTLAIPIGQEELERWAEAIITKGDQGTRYLYQQVPGSAELAKRVAQIPPFLASQPITWRLLAAKHPWIERAFVDVLPERITEGEPFEIGGVVVLSQAAPDGLELMLQTPKGTVPLKWGVDSPRMAQEHPQGKNRSKARWRWMVSLDPHANYAVIQLVSETTTLAVLEVLVDRQPEVSVAGAVNGLIFDISTTPAVKALADTASMPNGRNGSSFG
jgi:hypothetical protein